jgi:hypothetical protein
LSETGLNLDEYAAEGNSDKKQAFAFHSSLGHPS